MTMGEFSKNDYERRHQERLGKFEPAADVEMSDLLPKQAAKLSLDAKEDDPYVSASTIAEHVFCPRAALLTHEGEFSDAEEELPALSLMPWYEADAIEEAYRRYVYVMCALPVGLVLGAVILSCFAIGTNTFPWLLIGLILVWAYVAKLCGVKWWELRRRFEMFRVARKCNPDPVRLSQQPIDWWGLLMAGYEPREPKVIKDSVWRVSGKPRRILDLGSLAIPVHRINRDSGPALRQHVVRAMVHCHLVETQEGAHSPFEVILYGSTYKGVTIPNTRINRDKFYAALKEVRELIRLSDAGISEPPAPRESEKCSECPFGRPRPVSREQRTMRYGEPLEPVLYRKGRELVHCDCGDRFPDSKPKHNQLKGCPRVE